MGGGGSLYYFIISLFGFNSKNKGKFRLTENKTMICIYMCLKTRPMVILDETSVIGLREHAKLI